MSNILYLPRIQSVPGAKLYFRQTNTTTPQPAYADIDLTVAHSNPLSADADGYFDPIYLDPSLPDYRIVHTTSADVLIEQIDDIPAAGTSGQELLLSHAGAAITLEDLAQPSGQRRWVVQLVGKNLVIAAADDDGTIAAEAITINRDTSFGLVESIDFESINDSPKHNGVLMKPTMVMKVANTARSSTTTFASDSELSMAVPEGGNYIFEALIRVVGNGSSGAGGYKRQFTYSGTVGSRGIVAGGISTVNNSLVVLELNDLTGSIGYAAVDASGSGEYEHLVGYAHFTNAGTLAFQWAQNSSNAAATNVMAGSWIRLTKLSSTTS